MMKNSRKELRAELQNALQSLPRSVRADIVNRKNKFGKTLLCLASGRGLSETVEFLHVVCDANLELESFVRGFSHLATPLFHATMGNKLETVELLIKLGANINSVTSSGFTAVNSACYLKKVEMVKLLVQNGADINIPDENGLTCLMESVRDYKLCAYLIKHGADLNASDISGETALHHAIFSRSRKTVKILLDNGANPHYKNIFNDDALQFACRMGSSRITSYLLRTLDLPMERKIEAIELLGVSFCDNLIKTKYYWWYALFLRKFNDVPKIVAPPRRAFNYLTEFTTLNELIQVFNDNISIAANVALIQERILGPYRWATQVRMKVFGLPFVAAEMYEMIWHMTLYKWQLIVERNSVLNAGVLDVLLCLAQYFWDLFKLYPLEKVKKHIPFSNIFLLIQSIGFELERAYKLIEIKPFHIKHPIFYDRIVRFLLHFFLFCLLLQPEEDQLFILRTYVKNLLDKDIRTKKERNTLLHVAVIYEFNPQYLEITNPNYECVKFLLKCGADVNASNEDGVSPLYLAASHRHRKLFDLLLAEGGHIDQTTSEGDSVYDLIRRIRRSTYHQNLKDWRCVINVPLLPLKCLSARVINLTGAGVNRRSLPANLQKFVSTHCPANKSESIPHPVITQRLEI